MKVVDGIWGASWALVGILAAIVTCVAVLYVSERNERQTCANATDPQKQMVCLIQNVEKVDGAQL